VKNDKYLKDWNNKDVPYTKSKGGVIVVANPLDNLVYPNYISWPTPEIVQKLYRSRQIRAFDENQSSICTSSLGYYCDLQSLHSEDVITWSVFGTLAYSSLSIRERWVSRFFDVLKIPDVNSKNAIIFLWRRIPHLDTLVLGGPEIDFGISTYNALTYGEAKWQSGVGMNQGKKKDKDQIQLRLEFLAKFGKVIYPSVKIFLVVGVGLSKDAFNNSKPLTPGVRLIFTTWEDVCNISVHPHYDEIQRYYQWKLKHSHQM
jgi:hypothetical protein